MLGPQLLASCCALPLQLMSASILGCKLRCCTVCQLEPDGSDKPAFAGPYLKMHTLSRGPRQRTLSPHGHRV